MRHQANRTLRHSQLPSSDTKETGPPGTHRSQNETPSKQDPPALTVPKLRHQANRTLRHSQLPKHRIVIDIFIPFETTDLCLKSAIMSGQSNSATMRSADIFWTRCQLHWGWLQNCISKYNTDTGTIPYHTIPYHIPHYNARWDFKAFFVPIKQHRFLAHSRFTFKPTQKIKFSTNYWLFTRHKCITIRPKRLCVCAGVRTFDHVNEWVSEWVSDGEREGGNFYKTFPNKLCEQILDEMATWRPDYRFKISWSNKFRSTLRWIQFIPSHHIPVQSVSILCSKVLPPNR